MYQSCDRSISVLCVLRGMFNVCVPFLTYSLHEPPVFSEQMSSESAALHPTQLHGGESKTASSPPKRFHVRDTRLCPLQRTVRRDLPNFEFQMDMAHYRARRALYDANLRDHQGTHMTSAVHICFLAMLLGEACRYRQDVLHIEPTHDKIGAVARRVLDTDHHREDIIKGTFYANTLREVASERPWTM